MFKFYRIESKSKNHSGFEVVFNHNEYSSVITWFSTIPIDQSFNTAWECTKSLKEEMIKNKKTYLVDITNWEDFARHVDYIVTEFNRRLK
jgi:hypothetical protein